MQYAWGQTNFLVAFQVEDNESDALQSNTEFTFHLCAIQNVLI